MKILVNFPDGLQDVIEVGEGGDYSDQSAILHRKNVIEIV